MATKEKKVGGVPGDEQSRESMRVGFDGELSQPPLNGEMPQKQESIGLAVPQQKPQRKPDPELQMMARIDKMLARVDAQVAQRVVAWLASRMFGGQWTLTTKEQSCNMPPL